MLIYQRVYILYIIYTVRSSYIIYIIDQSHEVNPSAASVPSIVGLVFSGTLHKQKTLCLMVKSQHVFPRNQSFWVQGTQQFW